MRFVGYKSFQLNVVHATSQAIRKLSSKWYYRYEVLWQIRRQQKLWRVCFPIMGGSRGGTGLWPIPKHLRLWFGPSQRIDSFNNKSMTLHGKNKFFEQLALPKLIQSSPNHSARSSHDPDAMIPIGMKPRDTATFSIGCRRLSKRCGVSQPGRSYLPGRSPWAAHRAASPGTFWAGSGGPSVASQTCDPHCHLSGGAGTSVPARRRCVDLWTLGKPTAHGEDTARNASEPRHLWRRQS